MSPPDNIPLMDNISPPNLMANIVLHTIGFGGQWMDKDGQLNFY